MTENLKEIHRHFDQLPSVDRQMTPQQFAQTLRDKQIPTTYDRSIQAATNLLKANPPDFFLDRLANGFNFIGVDSFKRNLKKMTVKMNDEAQKRPLHYIYFPGSRSSHWVYDQLQALGINKAVSEISTGIGTEIAPVDIKGKRDLYIIEDWLISSANVKNQIIDLVWDATPNEYHKIHTCVLYSSRYAEQRLKGNFVDVWVADPNRIPLLEEILLPDDMDFLNEIGTSLHGSLGEIGPKGNTLTCGWWCIPDNIPAVFTNSQSRFQLIEADKMPQPY